MIIITIMIKLFQAIHMKSTIIIAMCMYIAYDAHNGHICSMRMHVQMNINTTKTHTHTHHIIIPYCANEWVYTIAMRKNA